MEKEKEKNGEKKDKMRRNIDNQVENAGVN